MVDVASGGRLEFGIGRGNTAFDYSGYGIPQEESRGRFEEATEIITKTTKELETDFLDAPNRPAWPT